MSSSEIEGPNLCLSSTPGHGESATGPGRDEPNFAEKIFALLDQISALDKTLDEARAAKIANIKKAIVEGTYHVSAAEVAHRIIDHIDDP
jgi:hypothetical protein